MSQEPKPFELPSDIEIEKRLDELHPNGYQHDHLVFKRRYKEYPDDGQTPFLPLEPKDQEELWSLVGKKISLVDIIILIIIVNNNCPYGDEFELFIQYAETWKFYPGLENVKVIMDYFDNSKNFLHMYVTFETAKRIVREPIEDMFGPMEGVLLYKEPLQETYGGVVIPNTKYELLPSHYTNSASKVPWIIKEILPKAEICVLYGVSGTGKTFVLLNMVLTASLGKTWWGKASQTSRVAYIVAEGQSGFDARLKAYFRHNRIECCPSFAAIYKVPDFLRDESVDEFTSELLAQGGADIIVIDTLSRVIAGGNENSSQDMGKAVANATRLSKATGALIIFVHHAGKDQSKGARGWSGLHAAADVELEITAERGGKHKMQVTKMKDGPSGAEFYFDLKPVVVGVYDDGDPITSCVVVERSASEPELKLLKLGARQALMMAKLKELSIDADEGVDVAALINAWIAARPLDDSNDGNSPAKRDQRGEHAKITFEALCRRGILHEKNGRVFDGPA